MRSYYVRVDPTFNDWCPYKQIGGHAASQRRTPCEDGDRYWSDVL